MFICSEALGVVDIAQLCFLCVALLKQQSKKEHRLSNSRTKDKPRCLLVLSRVAALR